MTELSQDSLIRYQLPDTAELIPLLHIAPSKTDIERMLVISPDLVEVLAVIVARIHDHDTGAISLVASYDPLECVWHPPSPLLLQHRAGVEHRPFSRHSLKRPLETTAPGPAPTVTTDHPLSF